MKKEFYNLISFVMSKKNFIEKFKYFLKLIIYIFPIMYSLSKNTNKESTSTSQSGDDIYPIF